MICFLNILFSPCSLSVSVEKSIFLSKQGQNKSADALNTVVKSSKQTTVPTQITSNKLWGAAKVNVSARKKSTTATVTKITELVLKPKPAAPKSSLTSKVTTKKYTTKPVAIESRSTKISHESTFRIQSIQKTSPKLRKQSVENISISVENEQITNRTSVNKTDCNVNSTRVLNKSFDIIDGERHANITSSNVTQVMEGQILQEITSAIVNNTNVMNNSGNLCGKKSAELAKENKSIKLQSPKKHRENDIECKSKSYDPIKARQFIQKQKNKRIEDEKAKAKLPTSEEEIKQRLSALRKNTLKIVEKNVQKARKSDVKPTKSKTFTPRTSNVPVKKVAGEKLFYILGMRCCIEKVLIFVCVFY